MNTTQIFNHIRRHIIGYFLISFFFYLATVVFFLIAAAKGMLGFSSNAWFIAALIIGSIYVLIAAYYFYANYLLPYSSESLDASYSETPYPKISLWIWQWIFPTMLIHLFVIFGFWLTTERSPLNDSIYTHPYRYGEIYKNFEAFINARANSPETKGTDYIKLLNWENAELYHISLITPYLKDSSLKGPLYSFVENEQDVVNKVEMVIYKIPFLIALAFGFLGTLIFTLKDLAYRFYTEDLIPKTFVNYLLRFLMVPSLCIVIAFFLQDSWLINVAPILFFFLGFFPDRAILYIEEKTMGALSLKKEVKHEVPLRLIQGMTDYFAYRFREVGIGDAQNLAFVDISYLINNLGFDRRIIYDFVAQALLLINAKEEFQKFQNNNIRDIVSLQCLIENVKNNKITIDQVPQFIKDKIYLLSCIYDNEVIKNRLIMLEIFLKGVRKRERIGIEGSAS